MSVCLCLGGGKGRLSMPTHTPLDVRERWRGEGGGDGVASTRMHASNKSAPEPAAASTVARTPACPCLHRHLHMCSVPASGMTLHLVFLSFLPHRPPIPIPASARARDMVSREGQISAVEEGWEAKVPSRCLLIVCKGLQGTRGRGTRRCAEAGGEQRQEKGSPEVCVARREIHNTHTQTRAHTHEAPVTPLLCFSHACVRVCCVCVASCAITAHHHQPLPSSRLLLLTGVAAVVGIQKQKTTYTHRTPPPLSLSVSLHLQQPAQARYAPTRPPLPPALASSPTALLASLPPLLTCICLRGACVAPRTFFFVPAALLRTLLSPLRIASRRRCRPAPSSHPHSHTTSHHTSSRPLAFRLRTSTLFGGEREEEGNFPSTGLCVAAAVCARSGSCGLGSHPVAPLLSVCVYFAGSLDEDLRQGRGPQ